MDMIFSFFAGLWLRFGRYWWSRLRRRLCERQYLRQQLPQVGSLEDIEACLKQVQWKMEGLMHLYDSISYPQTVWAKKEDDCDGFAILAAELLYRLNSNYRPVLITAVVRPVSRSHTVCAFNNLQGQLWFFDNARLRREGHGTCETIALTVGKRGKKLVCWDVRNHTSFDMIEFHRL